MQVEEITINQTKLNQATALCLMLKKPRYIRILNMLLAHGSMTVTQIYIQFRQEQTVASQWLAQLKRHDLVIARRDGKNILYSCNEERYEQVIRAITEFGKL